MINQDQPTQQEEQKVLVHNNQTFQNLFKSFFHSTYMKQTLNQQQELNAENKINYTLNALQQADNTNEFLLFPSYQRLQKIFKQKTVQIIKAFLKQSQSQDVKREINNLKETLNKIIRDTSKLKQQLIDGSVTQAKAMSELNSSILQKRTFALHHFHEEVEGFLRNSEGSIRNLAERMTVNWESVGRDVIEEEKKQQEEEKDQIDVMIEGEENQMKKVSMQAYRQLIGQVEVQIKRGDRGIQGFLHQLIDGFVKVLRESLIDVLDKRLRQNNKVNGSFQENLMELKRLREDLVNKFQSIQSVQDFNVAELASYSELLGKIRSKVQLLYQKGITINDISFKLFHSKVVKNKFASIFQSILKNIENNEQVQVCNQQQQLLISPSYPSKFCYTFDLDTKSVLTKEKMNLGTTYRSIICLQRSCLVASDPDRSSSFLQIQPKQILKLPDMLVPRGSLSLCRYNKVIIYATGGRNIKNEDLTSAQSYNIVQKQWKYLPSLQDAKSSHASVTLRDKIFTFGGYNQNKNGIVHCERYNIEEEKAGWTVMSIMSNPIFEQSCRAIDYDGKIYLFQKNYAYKFSLNDEGMIQCEKEVNDFDQIGYASQHYTAMKVRNNQLVWAFRNSIFSYNLDLI